LIDVQYVLCATSRHVSTSRATVFAQMLDTTHSPGEPQQWPEHGPDAAWRVVSIPDVSSAEFGLARQQTFADELVGQSTIPCLLIWRCRPALLVTPADTRLPHFNDVADEMQTSGWPVCLRKSGGGVCPVGPGTVQVSAIAAAAPAPSMHAKYAALASYIRSVVGCFGIESRTGPIEGAYCPGAYDLAVAGKKLAGMSQHWFRNRRGIHCVVTVASINVEESPELLASVVNRFYERAGSGVRCDADALTNVRLCHPAADYVGTNLMSAVIQKIA
jgi:lipoate-protein ligase A